MDLPSHIPDEKTLDEMLTRPSQDLNAFIEKLEGDIIILGSAGKIGVSLAMLASRSIRETGRSRKVIAVDLFEEESARDSLEKAGVKTIPCDLLQRSQISRLPQVKNVIYMAGKKFGTEQDQELTWAINVLAPDYVADHFRESGIVVYSTGCVYPLVRPEEGGCRENTSPRPVGEYAQSCLGRERVFSYYSKAFGTKICQYRLNYSIDLRYGILYDIGIKVFQSRPVELAVSHFNCIWQGDANRMALLCLGHCQSPPEILNITGPETISVKETAEKFGRYFNKKVEFIVEEPDSIMYLSDASKALELFGQPTVKIDKMIDWQAHWIMQGGRSLNKPTHFETTSGKF
jgi:nucleoside-diphosphate-sugar epimerase